MSIFWTVFVSILSFFQPYRLIFHKEWIDNVQFFDLMLIPIGILEILKMRFFHNLEGL